jgi:hypothetical protein
MSITDKITNDETYAGYGTINHFYANGDPDYTLFTPNQLNIISYAAKTARDYQAFELSQRTHDNIYDRTPMRGEIPLSEICKPAMCEMDTKPFTADEREDIMRFFVNDANSILQPS